MSKPKIIKAIDDLDYQGFYNKSTYLGDIRTDSTCLDSVLENGIYTFTGGLDEPTDTSHVGDYKWSLLVKSNQDSTSSIQIAERISGPNTNRKLPYYRYYSSGIWTEFKQELERLKVRSASDPGNYILIDGWGISFSTSDGGGVNFGDEGSPGSPVLAFYGNSGDELVRLNHIANPEDDYDVANKKYVDDAGGFEIGTTAPNNTKKLWIDTNSETGGLKYYDTESSTWKAVPVQYS